MQTVVKREEDMKITIKWNKPFNKKTKTYGPLPHKPIDVVVHRIVYMDTNGNILTKNQEENKRVLQDTIDKALEGKDEHLKNSYGIVAKETFNTKHEIIHINEPLEYTNHRSGRTKVLLP